MSHLLQPRGFWCPPNAAVSLVGGSALVTPLPRALLFRLPIRCAMADVNVLDGVFPVVDVFVVSVERKSLERFRIEVRLLSPLLVVSFVDFPASSFSLSEYIDSAGTYVGK